MPAFSNTDNRNLALVTGIILLIFVGINYFFNLMPAENALISFANYASTGLGAFLGLYGAHKVGTQNFVGRALVFLGLASAFSFIGYAVWDFYEVFLGIETPYPSLADLFYVLFFPCAAIGVSLLLTIYRPQLKVGIILEAIGIFVLFAAAIIYLIGWPDLTEATFTTGFFDIVYTITDAIIVAIVYMVLRISGGRIFKGLLLYSIGMLVLAAGDIAFAIRVANETVYYGDIADVLLISGYLFAAAGIYFTAQSFSNTNTTTIHNA